MATIEKRVQTPGAPVRYRVRWWAGDRQRSKTFDRLDAARRFKALLEGDMANGTYMDPKGAQMTVQAFSEGWWPTVVDLDGSVTFGPPKTKTSVRTVTLPRSVMADLVHHMNMNVKEEPGALLFIFQNGTPIRRSWFRGRVWLPADVVEQFKQSN